MPMSRFGWIKKLVAQLAKSDIPIEMESDFNAAIKQFYVSGSDWARVAHHCAAKGARFASLWADEIAAEGKARHFLLNACYEKSGGYLLLRATLSSKEPLVPSITEHFYGASRLERHCRDLLGIQFIHSRDKRRWVRHQSWAENSYPLRRSFPLVGPPSGLASAGDNKYPFHTIDGDAVYEIPVGPVHAGIIEPGHFRFQAVGETVLHLEERLGYVHKGIEKIAVGRDIDSLLRLAGRVSGDCTIAHTWAACQAAEQAAEMIVPQRALIIRAIMAERERVANHLGDIGAICNDVGFVFAQMQFGRLREAWQRRNLQIFGHRLMMDAIVIGGVKQNLLREHCDMMEEDIFDLRREIHELITILQNNHSLRVRLENTGVLKKEDAEALGCLGYVGRASGLSFDLRLDNPYEPYDQIEIDRVVQSEGDVAARVIQRFREILSSLSSIKQLLAKLPKGPIHTPWIQPLPDAEGIGLVEGWRGEIISYLRFDHAGHIARYFPRDPSWFNWPALESLIHGNIVPDFPVCNKSVNGSYAGHDL